MTKIDIIPALSTSAPAALSGLEPARRLIVLVPDMEADYMPALRRIWELANDWHTPVLLFSLCKDARQELSLRRSLVTMSAMMQDGRTSAEAHVEFGTNWVEVVKRNYQTGDMVVCFAEQRAGFLHRPLSQILRSDLKIPVYILTGLYSREPKSKLFSQTMAWSGFLGILAGVFILQVKIDQLSEGGLQDILLILSIIPEFWLILVWNGLFR